MAELRCNLCHELGGINGARCGVCPGTIGATHPRARPPVPNQLPHIVGELRELQAGSAHPSPHPGPRPSLKAEADAGPEGPLPAKKVVPIAPFQRDAILKRFDAWKADVRSMSVNEQLRLAADFLDQGNVEWARAVAKLAVANLEKA
jgi:hypothetical protein